MQSTTKIEDKLGRPIRDLRISVTDRCNFRCSYCMPAEIFHENYRFLDHHKLLSFDEIIRLVKLFTKLGVSKIRITGGEPLLRKDIPLLIENIWTVQGVEDIGLTTNGSLLARMAPLLKEAGLKRVTVSLDSLNDHTFAQMNGVGYKVESVLQGIDAAANAGLKIKVNMVVKKGVNDQDILPMARYFKQKGHTLRFIEYMDVGNKNGWRLDQVITGKSIIETIHEEMPLEPLSPNYFGEVATRYRYKGTEDEVGLITSVSQAFCSSCTRARLSAEGLLYTCLFSGNGFDLRSLLRDGMSDSELVKTITDHWQQRDDRYSEIRLTETASLQNKSKVEMWHIGG